MEKQKEIENLSNLKTKTEELINFPERIFVTQNNVNTAAEPINKKGSSFFSQKKISRRFLPISYTINQNNFKIRISNNLKYSVNYPAGILENLDGRTKEILLDNFTYSRTAPLALIINNGLFYQSSKPLLKDFVDYGLFKDLPRLREISRMEKKTIFDYQKVEEVNFQKELPDEKILPSNPTSEKNVVLSLSFGKDSLLSLAVAKEVGLRCYPAFINDVEGFNPYETKIKKKIIDTFSKEQKQPVYFLDDNTDCIFKAEKELGKMLKNKIEDMDMTNALLAFALELIPLAYHHKAKYIMFGNERNMSNYLVNKEGFRLYHAYDQSKVYTKKENQYLANLTDNNIRVISLVEPLYNIAEIKILSHRYPHLLKYWMTCSDNSLRSRKWCEQCRDCVEMYLYAAAVGINHKKLGFTKNLFDKEYENLHLLFGPKKSLEIYDIFSVPPTSRDEHLLAFLLAFRNGYKGYLIDLFKKKYLKEAERKESGLRKKFFGIHDAVNVPEELKGKVLAIYKEELKSLI